MIFFVSKAEKLLLKGYLYCSLPFGRTVEDGGLVGVLVGEPDMGEEQATCGERKVSS